MCDDAEPLSIKKFRGILFILVDIKGKIGVSGRLYELINVCCSVGNINFYLLVLLLTLTLLFIETHSCSVSMHGFLMHGRTFMIVCLISEGFDC